ncbi:hypothetical protein BaRGS_00039137 [Batillaria attramentaria]|uniref:Uncharacterized protein n=1 Tax=Batillaria attramentaria TaxID=370345 RepID=A0ABD0J3X8_9CAEN
MHHTRRSPHGPSPTLHVPSSLPPSVPVPPVSRGRGVAELGVAFAHEADTHHDEGEQDDGSAHSHANHDTAGRAAVAVIAGSAATAPALRIPRAGRVAGVGEGRCWMREW